MKAKYLVSCAMAAALSGGALAANAADPEATPANGPVAVAPAASSSGESAGQVIVTAQRRAENIQKVPMTVQALTNKTLQQLNIQTLGDLLKYTPNVTFGSNGPGQGDIFMRGLSAGYRGNQSSATVASFPNVAIYLDDQSMQFPARNADIYMADMDRVEVLEGPQGTLFGGGAEAGALRYITNKPNLDHMQAHVEGMGGLTAGGGPNYSGQAMINVPIVPDKLAVRAVVYGERQGGYIDNVPSNFQRSNQDLGNFYFNVKPSGGACPDGKPAGAAGFCALPNSPVYNNHGLAKKDSNPVDYEGARFEVKYQINPDWDVLIAESLQNMNAQGLSVEYPVGSNFQPLKPLQVTAFEPSYEKDSWENTAWTVNGKIGDLRLIYTGGYTVRNIKEQMDYTNYSRWTNGMYYECTGGSTGWGSGAPTCYSPLVYWHDAVKNTHLSNEVRISSPDDWRLRFIVGGYYEQFRIHDVMNFNYKTIPSCTPANLTVALAGGPVCVGNVETAPGSTANDPGPRGDSTAFGEDTQRGYDQTAIFGSADFDIIPNVLTISGGTRWYDYSEFEVGSVYATGTGCMNIPNGTCLDGNSIDANHDHVKYTGFKSRAVVTWHVTPDTLTYFLYSQGFRPGGFNRSATKKVIKDASGAFQFLEPNSYAPDSLTNYEIGLKTQLFDHRLLLNVSAYYMDWNNVQYFLFAPAYSINTTFGINGPSYNIKGVEVQATARVTDNLTVWASGSYNDASESKVPCLTDNIAGTAAYGHCITQAIAKVTGLGPFANPFGATGGIPAFSPKFQGNIRARYDWEVMGYKAFVQGDVNYTGGMWNQPASYVSGVGVLIPNTTYLRYYQPGYATVDASVGVAKDNWYAQIYATNLTNSHASTFTSSAQFIKSEVPLRPLVVGLKVGANF